MDTKRSLSAQMHDIVREWLGLDNRGVTSQDLADELARLAEQHFAGSVPAQTNPGAKHYERVMLTCAALEGAMVNVDEIEQARLAAEFAEEAADYALERIGWREAESAVSDATDAATVTDEVYRLQSVLRQARDMARALQVKEFGCEQIETLERVITDIEDSKTELVVEWGEPNE